jgi:hypothetical protein
MQSPLPYNLCTSSGVGKVPLGGRKLSHLVAAPIVHHSKIGRQRQLWVNRVISSAE